LRAVNAPKCVCSKCSLGQTPQQDLREERGVEGREWEGKEGGRRGGKKGQRDERSRRVLLRTNLQSAATANYGRAKPFSMLNISVVIFNSTQPRTGSKCTPAEQELN